MAGFVLLFIAFRCHEADVFQTRVFNNRKGESLPYRLLCPARILNNQKYPLVLFFHGAGERGNDNTAQLLHGVRVFASTDAMKNFPCFVIAPQCPNGRRWVETDWTLLSHLQADTNTYSLRLTMELLNEVVSKYPIDTQRLYVTGLSMGGFATWDLITRYPGKFAAAVPVCGGGDTAKAGLLGSTPIWAFHGAKDKTVKVSRSRDMVQAILKKTNHTVLYTEYATRGHNSWDSAYSDPGLLKWMFEQKRGK